MGSSRAFPFPSLACILGAIERLARNPSQATNFATWHRAGTRLPDFYFFNPQSRYLRGVTDAVCAILIGFFAIIPLGAIVGIRCEFEPDPKNVRKSAADGDRKCLILSRRGTNRLSVTSRNMRTKCHQLKVDMKPIRSSVNA